MFQNSRFTRFIPVFFVMLIISYFICQGIALSSSTLQTESAVMMSVDESIAAYAYFARNEKVVYGKDAGAIVLAVNSGEKVAKSDTLAVYYDNSTQVELSRRIEDIDKQIYDCNYVIAQSINKPDTSKLENTLISLGGNIANASKDGIISNSTEYISQLKSIVVRRELIYSDVKNIEGKLANLIAEKNKLSAGLTGHKTEIKASISGYFTPEVDGYENILSPATLQTLTSEQFRNLPSIVSEPPKDAIGRISENFEWYIAVCLDADEALKITERFSSSKKLKIKIFSISRDINVYLDSSRTLDDGKVIIILRGTDIDEELLKLRNSNIEIVLKTYTGIKIPKRALRQVDGDWGVYCISGQRLIFKKVNILYEADTYYISESEGLSSKEVYIYDEIVVGGKELSQNQVIE